MASSLRRSIAWPAPLDGGGLKKECRQAQTGITFICLLSVAYYEFQQNPLLREENKAPPPPDPRAGEKLKYYSPTAALLPEACVWGRLRTKSISSIKRWAPANLSMINNT